MTKPLWGFEMQRLYQPLPNLQNTSRTFHNNFCHSFEKLSPFLPRFLKKSSKPSATIVVSLTVNDFFLLHIEKKPISTLLPLEVMSQKKMFFFVADLCLPPAQQDSLLRF